MTDLDSRRGEAAGAEAYVNEWEAWHRDHDERLGGPHGFLAITNIHWLEQTPRRFEDAPGAWWTGPDGVSVDLDDDDALQIDGQSRHKRVDLGPLAERASIFAYWGDSAIEVAKRGGYDLIRPRHPDNPLRVAFTGTPRFDPDPAWVVAGRYVPFAEPRPTTVGAVVADLEHVYLSPGQVEFEVGGDSFALTAFDGHQPGELTILFTDATSGVTTYAANRTLRVGSPDGDGSVILDFNRAVNLPCAYTDLATCPLPPAGNHLPFAVEAGAKIPRERSDQAPVGQTPRPPLPEAAARA